MRVKRFIAFMVLLLVSGAIGLYAVSGTYRFAGNIYVPGTATIATLSVTNYTQTNIDAGASGTAGSLDIFPATASKGKTTFTAADNTGNTTTTITTAAQAGARTYTIPDAGASASFVMTALAQTIGGIKTLSALLNADGGIAVDTSNFTVSGTTGAVATASDLAVGGNSTFTGTMTGSNNFTINRTYGALPAATTGYVIGVPRAKVIGLGGGTNGAAAGKTLTTTIMDDNPAGEWTAIDADVVVSADATYARKGSNSLKLAIADTADATDGVTNTLGGGDQDYTDDESVGMWIYSTKALDAADLQVSITDSVAGETLVDIPAVAINTWTWVEVDISAVANASKDVVTDLGVKLSAAGAVKAAAGAFTVYLDAMCKWDSTEEEALTISGTTGILDDGVLSVFTAAGATLTQDTDYFVHYQSGAADAIVWITDQSAATGFAYVAY